MKVSVEELNSVQKRVLVEVPAQNVDAAYDKVLKGLQAQVELKGFRKGKAPFTLVKKLYHHSASHEVMDQLVRKHLFDAINELKIHPIAEPVLETESAPKANAPFAFSAVIDVMPSFEVKNYRNLPVSIVELVVTDKSIEDRLSELQNSRANFIPVADDIILTRSGQQAQVASVSHVATLDGKELPQFKSPEFNVRLGKNEIDPRLEEALYDLPQGQTKIVPIEFAADHQDAELAGKTVNFELALKKLYSLDLKSLDDEFAKDIGFDTLTEFKDTLKRRMENDVRDQSVAQIHGSILNTLRENTQFDIPPSMVDRVIDAMIQEMHSYARLPPDQLKKALHDNDLRNRMREEAKVKAKNTLILWKIGEQEKMTLSDDDYHGYIQEYYGQQPPDALAKIVANMKERQNEHVLGWKVLNFLVDNAIISKTPEKEQKT